VTEYSCEPSGFVVRVKAFNDKSSAAIAFEILPNVIQINKKVIKFFFMNPS
jgi:hypothetical protein